MYHVKKKQVVIITAIISFLSVTGCDNLIDYRKKSQRKYEININNGSIILSGFQYEVYCNSDYNYCICYPPALFIPKDEPNNTDGRSFLSQDGKSELRVYKDTRVENRNNIHLDIAFYQDTDIKTKRKIISRKLEQNCYFIYGIQDDKFFYQKTIVRGNDLITAILAYHKNDEMQYSQLIEKIFQPFVGYI